MHGAVTRSLVASVQEKIIVNEKTRRRQRLLNARSNNVWEYRTEPPADWAKPLPDYLEKMKIPTMSDSSQSACVILWPHNTCRSFISHLIIVCQSSYCQSSCYRLSVILPSSISRPTIVYQSSHRRRIISVILLLSVSQSSYHLTISHLTISHLTISHVSVVIECFVWTKTRTKGLPSQSMFIV